MEKLFQDYCDSVDETIESAESVIDKAIKLYGLMKMYPAFKKYYFWIQEPRLRTKEQCDALSSIVNKFTHYFDCDKFNAYEKTHNILRITHSIYIKNFKLGYMTYQQRYEMRINSLIDFMISGIPFDDKLWDDIIIKKLEDHIDGLLDCYYFNNDTSIEVIDIINIITECISLYCSLIFRR